MAVQIGARPDAGFEDPIGMMTDCHRRIERFLDILGRVARYARGRALTTEEAAAIDSALIYFRTAGPRHTEDEEQSLFPRLLATAAPGTTTPEGGRVAQLADSLASLESDHHRATELHQEVDALYQRWQSSGTLATREATALEFATGELGRIYSTHIAIEEGLIFPRAADLLSRRDLTAMASEFRSRRGLE